MTHRCRLPSGTNPQQSWDVSASAETFFCAPCSRPIFASSLGRRKGSSDAQIQSAVADLGVSRSLYACRKPVQDWARDSSDGGNGKVRPVSYKGLGCAGVGVSAPSPLHSSSLFTQARAPQSCMSVRSQAARAPIKQGTTRGCLLVLAACLILARHQRGRRQR